MKAPEFIDYGLNFGYLSPREDTEIVVIHHTGDPEDDDLSAAEIHRSHINNNGWSGIGYHYVIRKSGAIELGRPRWATGAHALSVNWKSVGIHVCGNFEQAEPTKYQIESLAYLVGWICEKYDISINDDHVIGHRDVDATVCPGENLYNILDVIRGKALWYQEHYRGGD